MIFTIIVCALSCLGLILLVAFKPSLQIKNFSLPLYPIAPLVGAIILLCFHSISFADLLQGLTQDSAVNPLKILVLFISMTVMSIFLDEVGFFKYLANKTLQHAKSSQDKLFVLLYLVVSVLTVFTSNDIIILTFTPFICYFAKNAKINPIPYLVAEFVAANTWSMLLIIGNPTNIYLAGSNGINFLNYFLVMLLPTLLAGTCAFFLLFLVFRKKLKEPMQVEIEEVEIKNKPLLIIGLVHLCACIVLLAISSYINLEMWLVCLCFALSLFLFVLCFSLVKKEKPIELAKSLKRSPWVLIPFVISMFVLVLSMEKTGTTKVIADALSNGASFLNFGLTSFLMSNLINNIPMSVLFSSICANLSGEILTGCVYASIIGSNIGAFLTPIGALAGIMWTGLIKNADVKFLFKDFVKYGVIISIPTILVAIGGLYLSLFFF